MAVIVKVHCAFVALLQLFLVSKATHEFSLPTNYDPNDPAFFAKFSGLLSEYKPLNLGLGAPDFNPSNILKEALSNAALSNDTSMHQYGPPAGHPRLMKAIARMFSNLLNRTLDPRENVAITIGGSGALYSIFQAFTNPGDEWIVFEPYYHMFIPMLRAARAVPKFVPLRPQRTGANITAADYTFDRDQLKSAFSRKTKGILVNTPQNPLGKMFTMEELTYIADLAKEWDVIVVFDEVYQFLNYDGHEHIRLPTFPGMFERTITVGSAGKMFTATGYRIGWVYGPKNLIDSIKIVHSTIVLTMPVMLQEAMAVAIEDEIENFDKPNSYISRLRRSAEAKRNYVFNILTDAGISPILPQGGYFTVANWTTMIDHRVLETETDEYIDYRFIRWLVKNVNVYGLPMSSTYGQEHAYLGESTIRLTMIKDDHTLQELRRLLQKWKAQQQ